MFKKPFHHKNVILMNSSDRRKLRDEILKTYCPEVSVNNTVKETADESTLPDEQARDTALDTRAQLVADLLPEPIQVMKIESHNEEKGILYLHQGQPLWIRTDDKLLIPTVYTLWKRPLLLPSIRTWRPVIEKLIDGADLMMPGVIKPSEGFPDCIKQNAIVSVITNDSDIPVAVGRMAVDLSQSRKPSTGKAVYTIHVYKDYLWAHGNKSDPPVALATTEVETSKESTTEEMEHNDNNVATTSTENDTPAQVTLTQPEIDEIMKRSVYQALTQKLTDASKLPMIASTFYADYIIPNRPADCDVDLKQTSWKKLNKFMKTLEKEGLVKTKEMRGELYLQSVDWKHATLASFVPYEVKSKSSSNAQQKQQESNDVSVKNVWKVVGNNKAYLEKLGLSADRLYERAELVRVLDNYVRANNLVDLKRKKMINMDPILTMVLLTKNERDSVNQLERASLAERLCHAMPQYHIINLPGKDPIVGKDTFNPIQIIVEERAAKKTVTRILRLEPFMINIEEMANRLKVDCASSISIGPVAGKKDAREIMVQGDHVNKVKRILTSYGVPERYVEVDNKSKKKSKNKK